MSEPPVSDWDARKYFAARRVWPMRHDPTPNQPEPGHTRTWAEWFELRYGETLVHFAARAKAEGMSERIEQWRKHMQARRETSQQS